MEKIAEMLTKNNPQFKRLMDMGKLISKILPKFEVQELTLTDVDQREQKFIAVLFESNPENKRRVQAIEDIFTDILPPFVAYPEFAIEGDPTTYAALLFRTPTESANDGKAQR